MTARHLHLGILGEEEAARHLASLGYRIAARNWRPQESRTRLELDLVAWQHDCLVFVEVKTRTRAEHGALDVPAHAAFTPHKQGCLIRAARMYLAAHDLWRSPCRFDLVCVTVVPVSQARRRPSPDQEAGNMILEHYTHVIELGQTLGGSHPAWQPW